MEKRRPRFFKGTHLNLFVQEDGTIFYDDTQKKEIVSLVNPGLAEQLRDSELNPKKQRKLVDGFYRQANYIHRIIEKAKGDILDYLRNKFPQGR